MTGHSGIELFKPIPATPDDGKSPEEKKKRIKCIRPLDYGAIFT